MADALAFESEPVPLRMVSEDRLGKRTRSDDVMITSSRRRVGGCLPGVRCGRTRRVPASE